MDTKFFLPLVFVSVLLVSCGKGNEQPHSDVATVRIDTVRSAGGEAVLQYPGRVVAATDAGLAFKVAGTLRRVYVSEGDHVRAGQLVAELDDSDYKVQLNATRAEYAQIKADAERVIALYGEGGTTASNYDKARYGLQQIEAKLQNHTNQLAYTKLYAPYEGYVQQKFFDSNETVAAGMPILSVLGTGAPEVEVNLPAASYVHRKDFVRYSCTLDVLPGEVLLLQLISVLPKANANQLYTMRLRLQTSHTQVAPGMSAWVTIVTGGNASAQTFVPATALVQEKGKTFLFLYNTGNQTVKRIPVDVLQLHTDGRACVMGTLREGDLVVSSGAHHVKNGDKVRPMTRVSDTNIGGLL